MEPIGTEKEREAALKEPIPPPAEGTEEPLSVSLGRLSLQMQQAEAFRTPVPGAPPTAAPGVTPPPSSPPTGAVNAPGTASTGGGTPATGGATAAIPGGGASVGPLGVSPATLPAVPAKGSYEAVLARLKGDEAPPEANVLYVAKAIADLGGLDLATTAPGIPVDQLKAKLTGADPKYQGWIDPQTWAVISALGAQGKGSLMPMFWTLFKAGTNSVLEKTIRKDKNVQAVLLGLSTLGNATVEQYMKAFDAIVGYMTGTMTEALADESTALAKYNEAERKKAEKKAIAAAKKAAKEAEKEEEKAATKERQRRLAAQLPDYGALADELGR